MPPGEGDAWITVTLPTLPDLDIDVVFIGGLATIFVLTVDTYFVPNAVAAKLDGVVDVDVTIGIATTVED